MSLIEKTLSVVRRALMLEPVARDIHEYTPSSRVDDLDKIDGPLPAHPFDPPKPVEPLEPMDAIEALRAIEALQPERPKKRNVEEEAREPWEPGSLAEFGEPEAVELPECSEPEPPLVEATAEPEAFDVVVSDDFLDLVTGIGAEPAPQPSPLELKDQEIAELQRNLEMLRPLGEQVGVLERQRIEERLEWEAEVSDLRAQLESAGVTATAKPRVEGHADDLQQVMDLVNKLEQALGEPAPAPPSPPATPEPTPEAVRSDPAPAPAVEPEAPPEPAPGTLARLEARIEAARTKANEQKQKAAQHWREIQRLRGCSKELQSEIKALRKQLRQAQTPVRRMLRKNDAPSADLTRLAALLEVDPS